MSFITYYYVFDISYVFLYMSSYYGYVFLCLRRQKIEFYVLYVYMSSYYGYLHRNFDAAYPVDPFLFSKICKWNITRLWHVTFKSFWMWCYANIRLVEVLMWPFWPSSQQVPLVKLFPSNWCVYLSLLNGYSLKEGDKHALNYARIAFCTKTSTNWCLHC